MFDIQKYGITNEGFLDKFKAKPKRVFTEAEEEILITSGKRFRQSFYIKRMTIHSLGGQIEKLEYEIDKLEDEVLKQLGHNLAFKDDKKKSFEKYKNKVKLELKKLLTLFQELEKICNGIFDEAEKELKKIKDYKTINVHKYWKLKEDYKFDDREDLYEILNKEVVYSDRPWQTLKNFDEETLKIIDDLSNCTGTFHTLKDTLSLNNWS